MKPIYFAFLIVMGTSVISADEATIHRVEAYLRPRLLQVDQSQVSSASRGQILKRSDPGTFFLRYAFGMKRHGSQLLEFDQSKKLDEILEKHSQEQKRWHDERNTLRCKFNQIMWQYAGVGDPEAARYRGELESWMRLRMAWTQQEHLAQYRFARDVWLVLSPDQQSKLIAGEWKAYAVQDTGHTRADATAKIITRALGPPDDQAAFRRDVDSWSNRRTSLQTVVQQTENDERRIVFAMDLNSESMAYEASKSVTTAYSALFLAEAEAFRQIVQAAYQNPAERCEKACDLAWSEASNRFTEGASELLGLLNP